MLIIRIEINFRLSCDVILLHTDGSVETPVVPAALSRRKSDQHTTWPDTDRRGTGNLRN